MTETSYENGYIYIKFRRLEEGVPVRFIYCAGVNIGRFRPLTWGTHGQFMNPAFRGLQLLRLKFLIPSVLECGGRVTRLNTTDCGDVPAGDGWFRETFELVDVPNDYAERNLYPCVRNLVEMVLKVARPGTPPPEDITDPARLERGLDDLAAACAGRS